MSKWVEFVKAMWHINRVLNKRLKEEFTLAERLRASFDFSLYALFTIVNRATAGYRVRPETSAYIDRSMVMLEESRGLPLDTIEKINTAAFENEPAYIQRKSGLT